MDTQPKKQKNTLIVVILLATLAGLTAGIVGDYFFRTHFLSFQGYPYFGNEISLFDLNNTRSSLIIRDAKKVVVNQDTKVEETFTSVQPTLVKIFRRNNLIQTGVTANVEEADLAYYNLNDPEIVAFTFTSDGWLIATLSDTELANFNLADYIAIDSNRRVYDLEEINVPEQDTSNLVFIHLAQASNLPVKSVAQRSDLHLGKSLVIVSDYDRLYLSQISAIKTPGGLLNSDKVNISLSLSQVPTQAVKSSFIFDLSGNLIALIDANKEIVLAYPYLNYWQNYLIANIKTRPSLDLDYINLSDTRIEGIDRVKGALIRPAQDRLTLSPTSIAAQAGLQVGDIITWVNNREINDSNDLSSILSTYKANDEISITYIRDGLESVVKLRLDSQELK